MCYEIFYKKFQKNFRYLSVFETKQKNPSEVGFSKKLTVWEFSECNVAVVHMLLLQLASSSWLISGWNRSSQMCIIIIVGIEKMKTVITTLENAGVFLNMVTSYITDISNTCILISSTKGKDKKDKDMVAETL
ncbi:hypothetical protein LXL04_029578 [Taraxacum kok-saghyz]